MADPVSATFAAIASATAATTAATATALTALGLSAAAASATASFLVQTAITTALSLAASALLTPDVNREGSPTDWRPDTNAGIPVVLGRAATAGKIIHMDEHGPDNRYLTIANLLSAGPIDAIESFQADRVAVTFSGTGATAPTEYADKMWLSTSTGASATALTVGTLPHGAASLAGWDANSTLPGLAHTLWTLYQDSKFKSYPQGAPEPLHILRGVKVYDPRKDSTYPGGSGSHRLDDPDTWEFSKNPGLHALAWCLGHTVTDPNTSQVFRIGIGVSASGVDWPAFVELANVCDTNDWEVSAVPTSTDDKHQVLKAILQAGGARYASLAGKISCIARTPRTSTVTVTAADTAGPFEIDVNADRLTRRNTITPRCVQEDHDWQMTPQDAVTVAEYVTADGGELPQTLDYPYVAIGPASDNKDQPEQLAAYAMLDSREPIAGTVAFRPHLAQVAPGDVFTVDEPGFLLDGVELLCLQRTVDAVNNVVQLTFVSESAGKHDFALGLTNTPPTPPGLTAPNIRDVPAPAAPIFSATAGTGQQPSIVLTATNADAAQRAYVVEYRPITDGNGDPITYADDETGWEVYGQFDITTENVVITGLEPNTDYQIAIRYVSEFGALGVRRILATITTGAMVADQVGARTQAYIDDAFAGAATARALLDDGIGIIHQSGAINLYRDPLLTLGDPGATSGAGVVALVDGDPRASIIDIAAASQGDTLDLVITEKLQARPGSRYQAGFEITPANLGDVTMTARFYDADGTYLSSDDVTVATRSGEGRIAGFVEIADVPAAAELMDFRLSGDAATGGAASLQASEYFAAWAEVGRETVRAFVDPQDQTVTRVRERASADQDRAYRVQGVEYESERTRGIVRVLEQAQELFVRYLINGEYTSDSGESYFLVDMFANADGSRILQIADVIALANPAVPGGGPGAVIVPLEVRNGIVHILTQLRLADTAAFTYFDDSDVLRICIGKHPTTDKIGIFLYDEDAAPLLEFNITDSTAKLYPAMAVDGFVGDIGRARLDATHDLTTASAPRKPADFNNLTLTTQPIPYRGQAEVSARFSYTISVQANAFVWFGYGDQLVLQGRATNGAWSTINDFGREIDFYSVTGNTSAVPQNLTSGKIVQRRPVREDTYQVPSGLAIDELRLVATFSAEPIFSNGHALEANNDPLVRDTLGITRATLRLDQPTPRLTRAS